MPPTLFGGLLLAQATDLPGALGEAFGPLGVVLGVLLTAIGAYLIVEVRRLRAVIEARDATILDLHSEMRANERTSRAEATAARIEDREVLRTNVTAIERIIEELRDHDTGVDGKVRDLNQQLSQRLSDLRSDLLAELRRLSPGL